MGWVCGEVLERTNKLLTAIQELVIQARQISKNSQRSHRHASSAVHGPTSWLGLIRTGKVVQLWVELPTAVTGGRIPVQPLVQGSRFEEDKILCPCFLPPRRAVGLGSMWGLLVAGRWPHQPSSPHAPTVAPLPGFQTFSSTIHDPSMTRTRLLFSRAPASALYSPRFISAMVDKGKGQAPADEASDGPDSAQQQPATPLDIHAMFKAAREKVMNQPSACTIISLAAFPT